MSQISNSTSGSDRSNSMSMDSTRSEPQGDNAGGRSIDGNISLTDSVDFQSSSQKLADQATTAENLMNAPGLQAGGSAVGSLDAAQTSGQPQDVASISGTIPNGLLGAAHGIANTGFRTQVENPQLSVRYEATRPAWGGGAGGFSPESKTILESKGIYVAEGTYSVPANSISRTPGVSPQSATNHNGKLAEHAIAASYSQIPGARVSEQYRYDVDLKPVTTDRLDLQGDRKVDVRVELDHPTDPRQNQVIEVESKATERITPGKLNTAQVEHDAARLTRNDDLRTAGSRLETVGKVARPVGLVLDAVDVVGAYKADGNNIGMNTGEAVSGIVGGGAVGWAGAGAGAALGTAILPGVGTVVGGLVGAAIGAWGGDRAGRGVFGTVAGWFD